MKVYAKNENIRKYIWHPTGKLRFNDAGEATWPDDQFTRRRLRDGDITLEAGGGEPTDPTQPTPPPTEPPPTEPTTPPTEPPPSQPTS